jgi:hypothetical protein
VEARAVVAGEGVPQPTTSIADITPMKERLARLIENVTGVIALSRTLLLCRHRVVVNQNRAIALGLRIDGGLLDDSDLRHCNLSYDRPAALWASEMSADS